MNWTPVDLKENPVFFKPTKWSEDALYCHKTDKACFDCPVFKAMGWSWNNGKCKQPISVQILVDKEAKRKLPKFTPAHHKVSLWQK